MRHTLLLLAGVAVASATHCLAKDCESCSSNQGCLWQSALMVCVDDPSCTPVGACVDRPSLCSHREKLAQAVREGRVSTQIFNAFDRAPTDTSKESMVCEHDECSSSVEPRNVCKVMFGVNFEVRPTTNSSSELYTKYMYLCICAADWDTGPNRRSCRRRGNVYQTPAARIPEYDTGYGVGYLTLSRRYPYPVPGGGYPYYPYPPPDRSSTSNDPPIILPSPPKNTTANPYSAAAPSTSPPSQEIAPGLYEFSPVKTPDFSPLYPYVVSPTPATPITPFPQFAGDAPTSSAKAPTPYNMYYGPPSPTPFWYPVGSPTNAATAPTMPSFAPLSPSPEVPVIPIDDPTAPPTPLLASAPSPFLYHLTNLTDDNDDRDDDDDHLNVTSEEDAGDGNKRRHPAYDDGTGAQLNQTEWWRRRRRPKGRDPEGNFTFPPKRDNFTFPPRIPIPPPRPPPRPIGPTRPMVAPRPTPPIILPVLSPTSVPGEPSYSEAPPEASSETTSFYWQMMIGVYVLSVLLICCVGGILLRFCYMRRKQLLDEKLQLHKPTKPRSSEVNPAWELSAVRVSNDPEPSLSSSPLSVREEEVDLDDLGRKACADAWSKLGGEPGKGMSQVVIYYGTPYASMTSEKVSVNSLASSEATPEPSVQGWEYRNDILVEVSLTPGEESAADESVSVRPSRFRYVLRRESSPSPEDNSDRSGRWSKSNSNSAFALSSSTSSAT